MDLSSASKVERPKRRGDSYVVIGFLIGLYAILCLIGPAAEKRLHVDIAGRYWVEACEWTPGVISACSLNTKTIFVSWCFIAVGLCFLFYKIAQRRVLRGSVQRILGLIFFAIACLVAVDVGQIYAKAEFFNTPFETLYHPGDSTVIGIAMIVGLLLLSYLLVFRLRSAKV